MNQCYINATTIQEVVDALLGNRGKAKIIAGATDLLLEMERGNHPDVETLVDISRITELDYINIGADGNIHVGAGTTHNQIAASPIIQEFAMPLAQACWQVGSPQIRNRATLGGNLVTASPANDTIVPLMAMGARLVLLSSRGKRIVDFDQFFTGVRKTIIEHDELLNEVMFNPLEIAKEKGVYLKLGLRKAQAISLVNICVILGFSLGSINSASAVLGCVAPTVIHAVELEQFLIGKTLTQEMIGHAEMKIASAIKPISDLRSSAEYRYEMARILTKHALEEISGLKIHSLQVPEKPVSLSNGYGRCQYKSEGFLLDSSSRITTKINDKKIEFISAPNKKKLLAVIREDANLTGTKEGCGEGECGACTVIMDEAAVMSCLVPAGRAAGAFIQTVESIGGEKKLNAIQESFIAKGAVQCGYCTPGFIISATKLLEEKKEPSLDEIKTAISGNLCRCTGYYKIIEAIEAAIGK